MPRLVQLSEMRERVYQRADLTNASQFITSAEVDGYINGSIDRLNNHVVAGAEDHFTEPLELTTTAGSSDLSLAAATDFFKLRAVEVLHGSNWRPMERWNFSNRARYENAANWTGGSERALAYRMVGGNLRLYPIPDGAYTVRVWYVAAPPLLVTDSDTYDGQLGWDEWVVIDAAIKCVLKEEGDASALAAERQQLLNEIMGHFRTIDEGRPDVVMDVASSSCWWEV